MMRHSAQYWSIRSLLLASLALPFDSAAAERDKTADRAARRVEEELKKGIRSAALDESQRQELIRKILQKGTTPTQQEIEKALRDWAKANPPIQSQKLDVAALARSIEAAIKEPNPASQSGMQKPSYDPRHSLLKAARRGGERTGKTDPPQPASEGRDGQSKAKPEDLRGNGPKLESKPEHKPEKPKENHHLGDDHPQHTPHLPDAGGDAGH